MGARDEAERRQFLSFAIAGTDYGLPILQVREIIQCDAITPVPSVPRWVRGVINLRGSVVPVMDLAVKLGQRETPIDRRTCILVVDADLGGERTVAGVMADSVSEVIELAADGVVPPPSFGTQVKVEYLLGMTQVGSRFALLLDLDRVLAADEADLAAARAAAEAEVEVPPPVATEEPPRTAAAP